MKTYFDFTVAMINQSEKTSECQCNTKYLFSPIDTNTGSYDDPLTTELHYHMKGNGWSRRRYAITMSIWYSDRSLNET